MALIDVTPAQAASLLAAAKVQEGKAYFDGGGARSNPSVGFDCSGLVWYAINQAHFAYKYSSTRDIPHNLNIRRLTIPPEAAMAGDIVLFSGHVGFFDPDAAGGKTLYSATSSGVHNEAPKYFGAQLGIYRLMVPQP